jgi:hypothetical protein
MHFLVPNTMRLGPEVLVVAMGVPEVGALVGARGLICRLWRLEFEDVAVGEVVCQLLYMTGSKQGCTTVFVSII